MATTSPVDSFTAPRWVWFWRGFFAVILVTGGVNAASYFVRSDGFGNLLGTQPQHREALGFPLQVWERGNTYSGFYADYLGVLANVAIGAMFGAVAGYWTAARTEHWNRIGRRWEAESAGRPQRKFQFSIRAMLGAMVAAAMIAALWRTATSAARPEALAAVYLFGPLVLVVTALAPNNIPWQQRVGILVPLTLLAIAAAIGIGASLPRPLSFDDVLLGVFVCWTPQTVAGAAGLTLAILWSEHRLSRNNPRSTHDSLDAADARADA